MMNWGEGKGIIKPTMIWQMVLLLNLVAVPALSSPLTWREWEIIVISPNCRRAIIWHIGCYGSDWLSSRCSWEDALGSFCHIKRWKQFQNKLLYYKTSPRLVWSSGSEGGILKALLEFQVWIHLGLATDQLPLGVIEFELKVATWRIMAGSGV